MLRTYHPLQSSNEGNYLVGVIQATIHEATGARVSVEENTILVMAECPRKALEEGYRFAKEAEVRFTGEDGELYRFETLGISHLNPIHGKLESGIEISWLDLSGISDAELQSRIVGNSPDEAHHAFDAVTETDSNYPPHLSFGDAPESH